MLPRVQMVGHQAITGMAGNTHHQGSCLNGLSSYVHNVHVLVLLPHRNLLVAHVILLYLDQLLLLSPTPS